MLGRFLAEPPGAPLLERTSLLVDTGGALGVALGAFAAAAGSLSVADARTEYDVLFIGVARGELVPYASFYLTGFLHERPLARLRADMARLGFARMPGRSDPEDHIASICETMASLIESGHDIAQQSAFFDAHLGCWAGSFFNDLRAAASARLYAKLASVGSFMIDLDQQAFALGNEAILKRGAA